MTQYRDELSTGELGLPEVVRAIARDWDHGLLAVGKALVSKVRAESPRWDLDPDYVLWVLSRKDLWPSLPPRHWSALSLAMWVALENKVLTNGRTFVPPSPAHLDRVGDLFRWVGAWAGREVPRTATLEFTRAVHRHYRGARTLVPETEGRPDTWLFTFLTAAFRLYLKKNWWWFGNVLGTVPRAFKLITTK